VTGRRCAGRIRVLKLRCWEISRSARKFNCATQPWHNSRGDYAILFKRVMQITSISSGLVCSLGCNLRRHSWSGNSD